MHIYQKKYFKTKLFLIIVIVILFDFVTNTKSGSDPIIVTIFFFIGGVSFFLSFLVFDELMAHEFKNHKGQWESDGKPGFFRLPEEVRQELGWRDDPQKGLMGKWLFNTPNWIKKDNYAKLLIWIYRVLEFCTFIGFIVSFFLDRFWV